MSRSQILLTLASATWGAMAAVLLIPWIQSWNDPPPPREQIFEIREELARANLQLVLNRRVDLEGAGKKAYLLVFRHRTLRAIPAGSARASISDEVRIYRQEGDGELVEGLSFQPDPEPQRTLDVPEPSRPIFTFKVARLGDLDGNGRAELIGAFNQLAMLDTEPLPVAIFWNDRAQDYRLVPLLSQKPSLLRLKHPGLYARASIPDYRRPLTLTDPDSGISMSGYAVEGYSVWKLRSLGADAPVLAVARIARGECHACPTRLAVQVMRLDLQGNPRTYPCIVQEVHDRASVGDEIDQRRLYNALLPRRFGGGYSEPDTSHALARARGWLQRTFSC